VRDSSVQTVATSCLQPPLTVVFSSSFFLSFCRLVLLFKCRFPHHRLSCPPAIRLHTPPAAEPAHHVRGNETSANTPTPPFNHSAGNATSHCSAERILSSRHPFLLRGANHAASSHNDVRMSCEQEEAENCPSSHFFDLFCCCCSC
jgi:hypothetical protein